MGSIPTSRQPHVEAYIGRPDGQTWVDVSSCLRSVSIDCGNIEQVGTQASGADGAIRRLTFSLQNEGSLREYWPEDVGRDETDEIGDDTDILADDWDSVAVVINAIFATANKWARDSFSQLDRDSYWNQFDGEFSPLLYSRREVEIQAAVTAPGQQPAAMFSLFRGYLGERVSTDGGTVEVSARDLAKRLQDAYIYIEREYGSDTETVPIETVMQQILDDNLGEGEVTLHCPEPTGRACRPYSPIDMSVWDALWQLTSQWGGWLGYAWDTQQGEYVLTLMMPPRDKGPENADFVFNASDIYVENLETYDDDIRNLVVVRYYDEIEKRVKTVIERDEDSIREFGERVMVIQTERLTTEAQARALAQLALHDLADYPATVEITLPFLPEMHLFAGILVTNPRISTRQEFYGVVSFRHELSWGEDSARFRTVVVAAGRVTGGHHRWLRMETRPGSPGRVASQLSGKVTTFFQDDPPTAKAIGDIWYDTDANPVVIRRWNGLSWVDITTTALSAALRAAQDAQDTADGKVTTYHADTEPEAEAIGDLWIDTSDDNKLYRWSGSAWVDIRDGLISTHSTQIANLADEVDSKITIFYQDNQPTANVVGDIWYDTDADPVAIHRWNGSQWIDITTTALSAALDAAGDAQATADGKIVTFAQASAPQATTIGDLWVDTDNNNKLYRWSGSTWVSVQDTHNDAAIASHASQISSLTTAVNSKITIFYQPGQPTANVTGDIWYDTDADPVTIKRWNGTQWIDITTTALSAALDAAGDAQATADGKIKTYYQASAPTTGMSVGDLWVDTDDGNRLYRYSGTQWVDVADKTPINADQRQISAVGGKYLITSDGATQYDDQGNRRVHTGYLGGLPWGNTVLPAGTYGQWGDAAGQYFRGYPKVLYVSPKISLPYWGSGYTPGTEVHILDEDAFLFDQSLDGMLLPKGRTINALITTDLVNCQGGSNKLAVIRMQTLWAHVRSNLSDYQQLLPYTPDQDAILSDFRVAVSTYIFLYDATAFTYGVRFQVILISTDSNATLLSGNLIA